MPESLHEGESLGGASRSSGAGVAAPACKLRLQRTNGEVRLCVRRESSGRHRLQHLRQSGAAKALFPRNHQDGACDVVLLNTAGGLAGGDELRWQATAAAGSALRLTTQTAERVYRSPDASARVATTLHAEAQSSLEWLPQETILFEGGRLRRSLTIDLAGDARFLAVEAVVFGRRASGETVRSGLLVDDWRVRRDGRLIYADAVRIAGDIEQLLDRPGTLAGGRAFATLLIAEPEPRPIGEVRAILPSQPGLRVGASALPHVIAIRMVATHGDILRPALSRVLLALRGAPLPRVWQD